MPVILGFRSKVLRRYWLKDDASGLRPDRVGKVRRNLDRLDVAETPEELDLPGSGFHALTGDLRGRYAVTVSRNWRLTFTFDGKDAAQLDLEDYHG